MTAALETAALETTAMQNRNRGISFESLVLVRTSTAKEDGTSLRSLFAHESAIRT